MSNDDEMLSVRRAAQILGKEWTFPELHDWAVFLGVPHDQGAGSKRKVRFSYVLVDPVRERHAWQTPVSEVSAYLDQFNRD